MGGTDEEDENSEQKNPTDSAEEPKPENEHKSNLSVAEVAENQKAKSNVSVKPIRSGTASKASKAMNSKLLELDPAPPGDSVSILAPIKADLAAVKSKSEASSRSRFSSRMKVDLSKYDNMSLSDLSLDVRPRIKNIIEELYREHDWTWPPAPGKDVPRLRFFKRKKNKMFYNQEFLDFCTFLSLIIGPLELFVAIGFAIVPKTFILAMRESVEITALVIAVFLFQGFFHVYAAVLGLALRPLRPFEIGYIYPNWALEVALPLLGVFSVFASMYMTQDWMVEREMVLHLKGYNFHWYSRNMWDTYQTTMHCCGVNSYKDWKYHGPLMYEEKLGRLFAVPKSCCKEPNCSSNPTLNNVWEIGCIERTMLACWTIYVVAAICVLVSFILLCMGHRSTNEAGSYNGDPIYKLLFDDRWSKKRMFNRSNRRDELFNLLNYYCIILGKELGFTDEVSLAEEEEEARQQLEMDMDTDKDRYEPPDSYTGNSPPTPGSWDNLLQDDMHYVPDPNDFTKPPPPPQAPLGSGVTKSQWNASIKAKAKNNNNIPNPISNSTVETNVVPEKMARNVQPDNYSKSIAHSRPPVNVNATYGELHVGLLTPPKRENYLEKVQSAKVTRTPELHSSGMRSPKLVEVEPEPQLINIARTPIVKSESLSTRQFQLETVNLERQPLQAQTASIITEESKIPAPAITSEDYSSKFPQQSIVFVPDLNNKIQINHPISRLVAEPINDFDTDANSFDKIFEEESGPQKVTTDLIQLNKTIIEATTALVAPPTLVAPTAGTTLSLLKAELESEETFSMKEQAPIASKSPAPASIDIVNPEPKSALPHGIEEMLMPLVQSESNSSGVDDQRIPENLDELKELLNQVDMQNKESDSGPLNLFSKFTIPLIVAPDSFKASFLSSEKTTKSNFENVTSQGTPDTPEDAYKDKDQDEHKDSKINISHQEQEARISSTDNDNASVAKNTSGLLADTSKSNEEELLMRAVAAASHRTSSLTTIVDHSNEPFQRLHLESKKSHEFDGSTALSALRDDERKSVRKSGIPTSVGLGISTLPAVDNVSPGSPSGSGSSKRSRQIPILMSKVTFPKRVNEKSNVTTTGNEMEEILNKDSNEIEKEKDTLPSAVTDIKNSSPSSRMAGTRLRRISQSPRTAGKK